MKKRKLKFALTISLAVLAVAVLIVMAYKRDVGFEDFNNDFTAVTDEIVMKIDIKPTSTGIDEAQQILNAKKEDLKSKLDHLKTVESSQLKGETMKKFWESLRANRGKMVDVFTKHADAAKTDTDFAKKMTKLIADHKAIIE